MKVHKRISDARGHPLLQPPLPPEYEWALATASDIAAMNLRAEALRGKKDDAGAPALATLLGNMMLLGIIRSAKSGDRKMLLEYAEGGEAGDSELPAPMPGPWEMFDLAAGMSALGLDVQDKPRVKASLPRALTGVEEGGRLYTVMYPKMRVLGLEPPLKPRTAEKMMVRLDEERRKGSGEEIANLHYALAKGGHPAEATEADWSLMREELEGERRQGAGGRIADMLVILREIPRPARKNEGPKLPPLRRFGR